MEVQHHSSIQKLLGVTAYTLKFVSNLKNRIRSQHTSSPTALTAGEISTAKSLWIQEAQHQLVEDPDFAVWKKQLELFCDLSGIWRCGGRMSNADLSYSAKHPVLLP